MKITDLLSKESIELNGKASSKEDVLNKMVALMEKRGNIKDAAGFKEAVFLRRGNNGGRNGNRHSAWKV